MSQIELRVAKDGRTYCAKPGVPPIERVLAKIEIIPISGCWIFMGALNETGYGIVGLGGSPARNDRAHRITFRHFVSEIPEGMWVLHRCDVPACCNPDHLFLGTPADNTKDMIRKGRGSTPPRNHHDVGSNRYNAKLNEEIVAVARAMVASGKTMYAAWKWLERQCGIGRKPAYKMLHGESWRHV